VVDLRRLWALASRWYDDRLSLDWQRRTPEQRQAIFAEVGLTGAFWSITD
jgi:hypothetical protein